MFDVPDREALEAVNDVSIAEFPRIAPVRHERDHPQVDDVEGTTIGALGAIDFEGLDTGSEIAITAGSRGIQDKPAVLEATVADLKERGYEPFLFPAMGSHGGATAEGQVETLASLGVTEESIGCEIRSSMDVEEVGEDEEGRPVYAATDALEADAVVLVNRIKAHTDFTGPIESGLCKMAVIGLGKQRGAEVAHNAAIAKGHENVFPERAEILFENTPIAGGVAIVENADDRAAHIEGVPVERITDREPELLERSKELLPTLPVDDLDLLVVDAQGKDVSGSGMDTNVLGRLLVHGQPEPEGQEFTRVHVRSITEGSHGNGIGVGLADFAHCEAIDALDPVDTYLNAITGGEPARARLPVTVPADATALLLAYSTTGTRDPEDMRIVRIPNTLDLGEFLASEPVIKELADRSDTRVGDYEPMAFEDGDLAERSYTELR
jgi:hypothetical protein